MKSYPLHPSRASHTREAAARLLRMAGDAAESPGLWFCMWRIGMDARELLDSALRSLGLRSREFWLLALVASQAVSQHELASLCGVDPSSMVALLDELESRGLVRRQRNPHDRRMHLIHLTEAGEKLYRAGVPLARRAEEKQMGALGATEQRRLLELVRRLAETETVTAEEP